MLKDIKDYLSFSLHCLTLVLSFLAIAIAISNIGVTEEKLWCSCVRVSSGTDTEMEACDIQYDKQQAFTYEQNCEKKEGK